MRYVSDDGEVFDSERECLAHENKMAQLADRLNDVDAFLDDNIASGRKRVEVRRWLRAWEMRGLNGTAQGELPV